MSFMKEVLKRNKPIWDKCTATPFVTELQAGTLPFEKFKNYMIQDSIYLKHYARVYGNAMYHSTVLKDIQLFYSILSFVTDAESAVRLNYLKQFGMTDDDIEQVAPLPENQNYIDFLLDAAESDSVCEILMAVLPCMLSYSYIFRKVAAMPDTADSRYWDFIQDYAGDGYFESCKLWSTFADSKCTAMPPEEQERLMRVFEQASILELDFWKMAYRECTKKVKEDSIYEKGIEYCGVGLQRWCGYSGRSKDIFCSWCIWNERYRFCGCGKHQPGN